MQDVFFNYEDIKAFFHNLSYKAGDTMDWIYAVFLHWAVISGQIYFIYLFIIVWQWQTQYQYGITIKWSWMVVNRYN